MQTYRFKRTSIFLKSLFTSLIIILAFSPWLLDIFVDIYKSQTLYFIFSIVGLLLLIYLIYYLIYLNRFILVGPSSISLEKRYKKRINSDIFYYNKNSVSYLVKTNIFYSLFDLVRIKIFNDSNERILNLIVNENELSNILDIVVGDLINSKEPYKKSSDFFYNKNNIFSSLTTFIIRNTIIYLLSLTIPPLIKIYNIYIFNYKINLFILLTASYIIISVIFIILIITYSLRINVKIGHKFISLKSGIINRKEYYINRLLIDNYKIKFTSFLFNTNAYTLKLSLSKRDTVNIPMHKENILNLANSNLDSARKNQFLYYQFVFLELIIFILSFYLFNFNKVITVSLYLILSYTSLNYTLNRGLYINDNEIFVKKSLFITSIIRYNLDTVSNLKVKKTIFNNREISFEVNGIKRNVFMFKKEYLKIEEILKKNKEA